MKIRYPLNIMIMSDGIQDALDSIKLLLRADEVLQVGTGPIVDDVYFIGPYRLISLMNPETKENQDESTEYELKHDDLTRITHHKNTSIATAVYLPPDYVGILPFLMLYKKIAALRGKPVLISENYLMPGELVVIPESSEVFATLFYNDGVSQRIPDEVIWYQWFAEELNHSSDSQSAISLQTEEDLHHENLKFIEGETLELSEPLLDLRSFSQTLLTAQNPVVQVHPIFSEMELANLLDTFKSINAWVRRTGENHILYSQETFDILEFSTRPDSPTILKALVGKARSNLLLQIISKLSGKYLGSLKEIYAFRMRANELITRHADSTLGGQLEVRLNLLLQSPPGRKYDLRFWNGSADNASVTRYPAIPNSATIFFLGDETPHDLTPMPSNCSTDRYNIVMTFGK